MLNLQCLHVGNMPKIESVSNVRIREKWDIGTLTKNRNLLKMKTAKNSKFVFRQN